VPSENNLICGEDFQRCAEVTGRLPKLGRRYQLRLPNVCSCSVNRLILVNATIFGKLTFMDLAKLYADMEEGMVDAGNQAIAEFLDTPKKSQKSSGREERDSSATAMLAKKRMPNAKRSSKIAKKNSQIVDVTEKYQGKAFTITGCGPSKARKRSP
jgi:hypothetical protein